MPQENSLRSWSASNSTTKGGFTRRYIDLKVDARGDFTQSERSATFQQPADAADVAINTKIEGWEIPQELRAIVQITPENAPIVVAAVGGQAEVDKRIVVPSIRSLVRNVYGGVITVTELDDNAFAGHEVLPLAILSAFVEAVRNQRAAPAASVTPPIRRERRPDPHAVCCDNFS